MAYILDIFFYFCPESLLNDSGKLGTLLRIIFSCKLYVYSLLYNCLIPYLPNNLLELCVEEDGLKVFLLHCLLLAISLIHKELIGHTSEP